VPLTLIAKIILGGYWLMLAPVLFLPLGTVLLSPEVLRGVFGYVVLPLAVVFAGLGAIFIFNLTLPDAVTVLAGVQAIWLLAAAIKLLARNGKQRGSQSPRTSYGKIIDHAIKEEHIGSLCHCKSYDQRCGSVRGLQTDAAANNGEV
jgi:hypothetical protein